MVQVGYALLWWFILFLIGIAAFPIVSRVCNRLQDKGYSISRPLGLLLIGYSSWMLASLKLIKFGSVNITVSLLLLLVLSVLLGRKHLKLKELPWKSILITEAVFAVAYCVFLFILSHKPDLYIIWSEDFMDFGFLNSILRSDYFPPTDIWASGLNIPYYYGGHLLTAVLVMISKIPTPIAYNLAVAMFFALAVSAAYGLGCNILKGRLSGLITVLFVCIAGFISGAFQLAAFFLGRSVEGYTPLNSPNIGEWFLSFDFVTANRIIPGVVNHYPYYAYMVGDMHANVMDIPFQLTFVGLVLARLTGADNVSNSQRSDKLLKIFLLSLCLGFLMFVNSWSFPIYVGFAILAFLMLKMDLSKKSIIGIIALSVLLFLPYYLARGSGTTQGLGIVDERTGLAPFAEIFALFLVGMFALICVLYRRNLFGRRLLAAAAVIGILTLLIALLMDFQLLLVIVPLILVPLYYIFRSSLQAETKLILILIVSGAIVALFFEIFFIDDPLSAPAERYNSLLKVYMGIWVLWGIASAYGVLLVARKLGKKSKRAWVTVLSILILAALVHPIATTTSWASGRYSRVEGGRLTLDGMAYLEYEKPGDYGAITWLRDNVKGSQVILETTGIAMEYSSPASAFTGLPTLLGWEGWQVMWRDTWDLSSERKPVIEAIYQNPDSEKTMTLLKDYDIEYIYVGILEKEKYEAESLEKFAGQPARYELVYENEDVSIYHVLP